MGKKNKKNHDGEQKEEGDNKKKENEGGQNDVSVVLKADFHCEGCASKVIKCLRSSDGVETVTMEGGQKIRIVGKVDPVKLRGKVEQKTHRKVEIISPQPKKDADNGIAEESNGADNAKPVKKKESRGKNSNDKSDEKKSKEKEPPVTTAVLKVNLHCDGCVQKIHKTVSKTQGYQEMEIDKQKDLVTVTGTMDMKALAELLQKQLKKDVTIVPPEKKEQKKEKGGGDGEERMEGNKMQALMSGHPHPYPYPYPFVYAPGAGDQFNYNPYAVGPYHAPAPQIFSDENPNSCSVM